MKKNVILRFTNPVMLVLVFTQAVTAVFHLKISREAFEVIHQGGGIVLLTLIGVHIVLNYRWFKSNYFRN
jgi:heme A synthase